jgi:uncharacterized protein (DUF983 family)
MVYQSLMSDAEKTEDQALFPPVDPVRAALSCACPRCGQGKLFDGLLTVRPVCRNCGLDYSFADSGDGPAVFVIMIIGFIVVGLALYVDSNYGWPIWLHLIFWIPLAVGLSLWLLRVLKALLIALQYRNKAKPGEIDRG